MPQATLKTSNFEQVRAVLRDALQLGARGDRLTRSTALLGSLPELDSMAVITVIGALEEKFGISVDDDDISAETFATLGSLADFVDQKLST